MSKFFLHGGDPSLHANVNNIHFWRRIAESVRKNSITVSSIGYASSFGVIDSELFDKIELQMANFVLTHLQFLNPHKKFAVVPAPLDVNELSVKNTDIVFIHGGDGDRLQQALTPIRPRFIKEISKLVCAGNSAGANIFAQEYYSNDNQAVCDGFAILPILTFCHYESQKWKKLNELMRSELDSDVITLADDEYIEYESI
ncbi:MAG: hypothetical protein EHM34_04120 [Nitrosopumilales archaeon]|nr:MAG: hypothetical protein EHM34_04120 [Nitrosopumilales archaeon]